LDIEAFPIDEDDPPPFCVEKGWMDARLAEILDGMYCDFCNCKNCHWSFLFSLATGFRRFCSIAFWEQKQADADFFCTMEQLIEGLMLPPSYHQGNLCQYSFVIRGFSAEREELFLLCGWKVASDKEIDQFLGVTAASLAPKEWRAL
jgi:hypothetical protein